MNRIKDENETYKISNSRISEKKSKKSIIKFKHILLLIVILIIILAIKTGIFIANWQNIARDMISNTPSQVLDSDGKVIAEIGTNKNTKNVSFSDIPDNLKNAYVSIEDQRFYKHSGVDLPRTTAAILSYIKNLGSASFGGSSITQQLVKNLTGDNSSKITRKLNEWIKAFAIENVLNKDEILESYLNIIYVGPNIYGVELGSKYYFNKSVSELDLAECAFLAGINNSPNSYNPFGDKDNSDKIKSRTKTVLSKMLELEYINNSEYDTAIAKVDKGLSFKKGKIEKDETSNIYSYHTDALINEIINDIAEKKNISTTFANNYVEMAGLKIYSTQNTKIQETIESEFSKSKYLLKSTKDSSVTSQAAMVVIDHSTGQVLGCVGGLGKKKDSRGFNRATQALRQTGSAGKPLAVLAPALSENLITATSIYTDKETTFDDGSDEGYSPTNYNTYKGDITVRNAVESSQNIPFVKIMEELTPTTSIKYMKKMGITSLTKKDENLNLALGGLDKGISPLEMATAYSVIANNGIYIEPTFYIKIENSSGKNIVKPKQKKKQVLSEQVSFILQSLLTEPVNGNDGTASYCEISGIDVAAKTGTTNDDYDRWLCGFTPYYTAVTWFGFDLNETINFNHKNPSGQIWSSVMKQIHSGLSKATFKLPSKGVETLEVCHDTGLLATSGCSNSYVEYYLTGTEPHSYCDKHTGNRKNSTNASEISPSTKESTTPAPIQTPVEQQTTNNAPITNNAPTQSELPIVSSEPTTPSVHSETSNNTSSTSSNNNSNNNNSDNVDDTTGLQNTTDDLNNFEDDTFEQ